MFMLLILYYLHFFNTFVINCHKSLQCIVDIVAISLNLVDLCCLGYIHVIISNLVIQNCLHGLHCFCAKILFCSKQFRNHIVVIFFLFFPLKYCFCYCLQLISL
jgi:hypothetical protein